MGITFSLPQTALIRNGRDINGLYLEWIIGELKPEQLKKLIEAKEVAGEMGRSIFNLTENQLNTIREFANRITP